MLGSAIPMGFKWYVGPESAFLVESLFSVLTDMQIWGHLRKDCRLIKEGDFSRSG